MDNVAFVWWDDLVWDQVNSKWIGNIDVLKEQDSLESKIAECVRKYEAISITICENCGADNAEICKEPPVFRWISALCPSCKEERIALYNRKMEERERYKEEMLNKKADCSD